MDVRFKQAIQALIDRKPLSEVLSSFRSNGAISVSQVSGVIDKIKAKHPHDPSRVHIKGDGHLQQTIYSKRHDINLILREELDLYMQKWTHPSTAVDASGWTDAALVHAYFKCAYFRDVLRFTITALLRAAPDLLIDRSFFTRAGMALRKPGVDLAVRPITWDTSILKLTEGYAHSLFSPKIYTKLDPCQVTGLSGGIEMTVHAIRILLHMWPSGVIIQTDADNAFCSLLTHFMLQSVDSSVPDMLPFIYLKYKEPSTVRFDQAEIFVKEESIKVADCQPNYLTLPYSQSSPKSSSPTPSAFYSLSWTTTIFTSRAA